MYVVTLVIYFLSVGTDNFSLRSVRLISPQCYGLQIVTCLAAYIFGQLSYKIAYRVVYTVLIALLWVY